MIEVNNGDLSKLKIVIQQKSPAIGGTLYSIVLNSN